MPGIYGCTIEPMFCKMPKELNPSEWTRFTVACSPEHMVDKYFLINEYGAVCASTADGKGWMLLPLAAPVFLRWLGKINAQVFVEEGKINLEEWRLGDE